MMTLNVKSAFFVAQAVVRVWWSRNKGSIINISARWNSWRQKRTVYCASKHTNGRIQQKHGIDLAENGIRVNTVCPTFVETELTKPSWQKGIQGLCNKPYSSETRWKN